MKILWIKNAGQTIALKQQFKNSPLMEEQKLVVKKHNLPSWMELDKENLVGKILKYPAEADLEDLGRVQSVLEFYSR